MKNIKRSAVTASLAGLALLMTACSPPSEANNSADSAAAAGVDEKLDVGFFGFAASNSFAQGTYLGVEKAAAENNATATFVDSNFDPQTQVQQIQDAVTSQQFDVIVVQANDNQALVRPLEQAIDAGITVVVEFSVVGPKFDTIEPQIPGVISIVDSPTVNGTALGEMGRDACAEVEDDVCQVAYLEGFKALPLDNARTDAVIAALEEDPKIEVVASVEGGYTQDSGRQAYQDVSQANPDLDVVIGASQAITGVQLAAGEGSELKLIGNGASKSNVEAVRSGDWFSIYVMDVVANGAKATELGLAKARGEAVEMAIDEATLAPNGGKGTKEALEKVDFEAQYSD
ncbi:sugar ABC transporter substrate-binding protein [Arthrobacter sp. VKM Ac-2550]|uniref:sugar ABC transporter substrate-binding protein n=1 Tax=Crystallibacter permensis TaxID=1938888 RepID=UPI0022274B2D|nr:sugar ABC transporter substrate-binding protein [Arthrobacter sp. VKM Ac-2550]MCW2132350.1 monosaccharide ABC transporter substrate-binding protein, CUT2 family [Arthrobacter sp. VKM Ac-2550]